MSHRSCAVDDVYCLSNYMYAFKFGKNNSPLRWKNYVKILKVFRNFYWPPSVIFGVSRILSKTVGETLTFYSGNTVRFFYTHHEYTYLIHPNFSKSLLLFFYTTVNFNRPFQNTRASVRRNRDFYGDASGGFVRRQIQIFSVDLFDLVI